MQSRTRNEECPKPRRISGCSKIDGAFTDVIVASRIVDRLAHARLGDQWIRRHGTPQYAIIDDLLPDDIATAIYRTFAAGRAGFTKVRSFRESKSTTRAPASPMARSIVAYLGWVTAKRWFGHG